MNYIRIDVTKLKYRMSRTCTIMPMTSINVTNMNIPASVTWAQVCQHAGSGHTYACCVILRTMFRNQCRESRFQSEDPARIHMSCREIKSSARETTIRESRATWIRLCVRRVWGPAASVTACVTALRRRRHCCRSRASSVGQNGVNRPRVFKVIFARGGSNRTARPRAHTRDTRAVLCSPSRAFLHVCIFTRCILHLLCCELHELWGRNARRR